MRMDRELHVGHERSHFDGEYAFGDELTGAASDNADAEDTLGRRIDDELRHAVGSIDGDSAAKRGPRKLRDLNLTILFFGIGLR